MSVRKEFSKSVRIAAWELAGGICQCGCRQKITGTPEYHHIVPAALGGSGDLENCRVMAKRCHRVQTSDTDVPEIARSRRIFEKRIGARGTGRGFPKPPPGYDAWTRRMRDA